MAESIEERAERNDPEALKLLGEQRLGEGDTEGAKKYLFLAMQLGNTTACHPLGKLYLAAGDTDKAIAAFSEGHRSGDEQSSYSLAEALLKRGDQNALAYITEYANEDDETSIRLLFDYYAAAGNQKQADYWKSRLKAVCGARDGEDD